MLANGDRPKSDRVPSGRYAFTTTEFNSGAIGGNNMHCLRKLPLGIAVVVSGAVGGALA